MHLEQQNLDFMGKFEGIPSIDISLKKANIHYPPSISPERLNQSESTLKIRRETKVDGL